MNARSALWRRGVGWTLRVTLVLSAVVVLGGAAGWLWDRSEEQAFWDLGLEPPGEWVQLGDRRIHIVVRGAGSPGVLFISGGGDGHESFREVQESIAAETLTVTYDRVGLKWSPTAEGAASIDQHVDDVGSLISDAGLFDGPVVLVGHSYGGTIARVAAERFPELVGGVVLLDAAEAYAIPPEGNRFLKSMRFRNAVAGSLGITRWRYYRENQDLTHEERLRRAHLSGRGGRHRRESYLYIREALDYGPPPSAAGTLGSMPLTVISATNHGARTELPEQDRMAALSEEGRQIDADTGHYVHWDDPGLVISEVRRMVQQLRGDGATR